jgi:peptide chain release factor 2
VVLQKSNRLKDKVAGFLQVAGLGQETADLWELAMAEDDQSFCGEIEGNLKELERLYQQLQLEMLLSGPYDSHNAIMSLHAGAGGVEAQDWVEMLYRMYTRYCERKGYRVSVLDYLAGDEAGIKSVTISVDGENAYGYLKGEKGVHRLVRISPFDANSRRHTSFASVDVMPQVEQDNEIEISPDELKVDTYRSGGAGGQHVNKTDSAVRITHLPTGIITQCQEERSQHANREKAMKMLQAKLLEKKIEEQEAELSSLRGDQQEIGWGSQIRSYVFQPYRMIKDHRTGVEAGNIDPVMDGDLDAFISAYLYQFRPKD